MRRVKRVQVRAMRTRSSGSAGNVPVTATWSPVLVSVAMYWSAMPALLQSLKQDPWYVEAWLKHERERLHA